VFLITGLITTSWYAYRASQERDVAIEANRKMQLETDKAHAINEFLIDDLLSAADPVNGIGHDVTIVAALEASAKKIGAAFAKQPEVEVTLRRTIGTVALRIGSVERAEQEFRKTIELQQSLSGVTDTEVAETRERLGLALRMQGRLDDAITTFEQLVEFRRTRAEEDPVSLADALHGLASTIYRKGGAGSNERAELINREALAIYEAKLGPDHPSTLDSLGALSNALYSQGKIDDSLKSHERILAATIRQHGDEHFDVARYKHDLAVINMKVRNYTRAETLLTQTVDTMRSLAGEANPIVAKAIGQHGRLYAKQKDFGKAESYYVKALRIQREHLDPNHADLAWTLTYLARARTQLKKHDEAEPLFKEMYETAQVVRGKENKTVAIRLYDWARCLAAQYKYEDAEPKLREALRLFEIVFKPGSLSIDRGRIQLAACLTHLEKFAEAEPLLQTAYGSVTTADEPDSTTLEDAINALIELYEKWNRPADAAEWKAKRHAANLAEPTGESP